MTASVYNLHVDLAHLKRNVKKKQEQVQSSGKVGIKEVVLILL